MLVLGVTFDCSSQHAPPLADSPCTEIAAMSRNAAHFHNPSEWTCVLDAAVDDMIDRSSPGTGFAMRARRLTYAIFAW